MKVEKVKGAERRTVTFSYDPQGRRVGKQLTSVIDEVTKTQTWSYVYDNNSIILETFTDDSGTISTTFFTDGAGVDEHLALERDGQPYYHHQDGLGSVVNITDSNSNVVQSYHYNSFGMTKPTTTFRNSYAYTGREWDKETGLYYYRARYYDPMEGRFISKDPIGFRGGVNYYDYVGSNPINNADPTGLIRWSGSSGQASYVQLAGGTGIKLSLESECVNGKKSVVTVLATGLSVGLGYRVTGTLGGVSFDDYDDVLNPANLNGVFEAVKVGATIPGIAIGGAAGYMRLGKAFTPIEIGSIFTMTVGRDRSISGTLGKSTVIDSKTVDCSCK